MCRIAPLHVFHSGIETTTGWRSQSTFNDLQARKSWHSSCPKKGMNIILAVLAIQVIVTLIALVRESGEDAAFEGDKLNFRS